MPIIEKEYQWTVWAMPKGNDGKLDHHKAMSGDDLTDFVNGYCRLCAAGGVVLFVHNNTILV
jgi:hypothetical protein